MATRGAADANAALRSLEPARLRGARGAPASLPAFLGLDPDALSSLAHVSATIFALTASIVLIATLAALLYAIVRELRRDTLFVDPIDVPRSLDARGYSPAVVAERVLDALSALRRTAPTIEALRGVEAGATVVDLHLPQRWSLRNAARGIHRMLRIPETHIGGEITREDGCYELTLRRREQADASIVGVHRSADIAALLALGAEDLLRMIDPWVLAQHYFAEESRDRQAQFPRTMAMLEHMLEHSGAAERPWAQNMQGICLMQQERLEEAIESFASAAAAGPQLAFVRENWADALDRMGRFDEARKHRLRALEIPGRSASLVADNAISASLLHRHDRALALARRALALAPQDSRAWSAWSYVLFRRHRLEQAAGACERALSLGTHNGSATPPAAALVYAALARPERALAAALDAIEKVGATDDTLKGMGFARLSAGDARGAVANFEAALALAPGAGDAAFGRGDALLALGEPELALAHYERAVAIDPFYPQAHAGWARALWVLGRVDESPDRFAVAVRVDSAYAPAYRGWAESLSVLGRDDEAKPLLAQAAAVERRNRAPLPLRQIAASARKLR
jgi:tetratricopeptide (TPR) repeat protein